MSVVPRRYRWWVVLAAAAFALTLLIGIWRPIHSTSTESFSAASPRVTLSAGELSGGESSGALAAVPEEQPLAIDWGSVDVPPALPPLPLLQVGAYITNISDINLMDNQFSIELLLWTVWYGEADQNPSDQLRILNGIYDGDIQRFERVRRDQKEGQSWSLYKVRSAVVKRWLLQRYPFDEQLLHVHVGLDDPLQPVNLDVVANEPCSVTPGLLLPGWNLKEPSGYASSISLMNDLGRPVADGVAVRRQSTVSFDLPIQRESLLFVAPDFLGYLLAVGLCCMSLLITRSRDDLILSAVVSAGGNYVFIAGNLPVTAMTGFIGNLQLIIFLGILYVVAADELIDTQLSQLSARFAQLLKVMLLPSYVGMTLLGIWWIIP